MQQPVHQLPYIGLENAVGSDGMEYDVGGLAKAAERCQGLSADGGHHVRPVLHTVVVSPSARNAGQHGQPFSRLPHGKPCSSLGDVGSYLAP